jgi:hypothetical protein
MAVLAAARSEPTEEAFAAAFASGKSRAADK